MNIRIFKIHKNSNSQFMVSVVSRNSRSQCEKCSFSVMDARYEARRADGDGKASSELALHGKELIAFFQV